MPETLNPPDVVTAPANNNVGVLTLNVLAASIIVRNRSATLVANVNVSYSSPNNVDPKQNGDDAVSLFPGDSVEFQTQTASVTKEFKYRNAADGEEPTLEVLQTR